MNYIGFFILLMVSFSASAELYPVVIEVHYFPDQGHVFHGPDEIGRRELVLDFLRQVP